MLCTDNVVRPDRERRRCSVHRSPGSDGDGQPHRPRARGAARIRGCAVPYRLFLNWLAVGVVAVCGLAGPACARAASVIVLGRDGHATVRDDPSASGIATPSPALLARAGSAHVELSDRALRTELARLLRARAISSAAYSSYLSSFNAALAVERRVHGTRARELEAVIENLQEIGADGMLAPSRLPALFLTLDRNRQWWASGPLLNPGQLVSFSGSQLDWEYYQGQGIELQMLASFGKAAWYFNHGRSYYPNGQQLLSELIPLASERGDGIAWEYYFQFDGGTPPWTSAMSQGTALQALAAGYKATGNQLYLTIGSRVLHIFTVPPPLGVGVRTNLGARYVQYTFDPARRDEVINAFLQSLIGLDDYAHTSRSALAARLFAAGNAEAQAEVPQFDTGAWSLYQPGIEDNLSYHDLVTGFLQRLCAMTTASVYCSTGAHFEHYLKAPPQQHPS